MTLWTGELTSFNKTSIFFQLFLQILWPVGIRVLSTHSLLSLLVFQGLFQHFSDIDARHEPNAFLQYFSSHLLSWHFEPASRLLSTSHQFSSSYLCWLFEQSAPERTYRFVSLNQVLSTLSLSTLLEFQGLSTFFWPWCEASQADLRIWVNGCSLLFSSETVERLLRSPESACRRLARFFASASISFQLQLRFCLSLGRGDGRTRSLLSLRARAQQWHWAPVQKTPGLAWSKESFTQMEIFLDFCLYQRCAFFECLQLKGDLRYQYATFVLWKFCCLNFVWLWFYAKIYIGI